MNNNSKLSPDQEKFAHLKLPLEEIVNATNNFAHENLIHQGGFGKIYKANIPVSGKPTDVVARRLHNDYGQGDLEFWNEIAMLDNLKHDNLVTLIGFCDEKDEKIIINELAVKGSLDKYLTDPTLTWMQRLQICVGVARALSYIHFVDGRDFSVIHSNIKSSKILLDENWKPKLSGFELSKQNSKARRNRIVLAERSGTIGYADPTFERTGFLTHKSDVYSLGVVLFEVLCGRRAFVPGQGQGQEHSPQFSFGDASIIRSMPERVKLQPLFTMKRVDQYLHSTNEELLAKLAISHYDEVSGNLDDVIMIIPALRKKTYPESFRIFSEIAYRCLKEKRARPNIDKILKDLEKALDLQMVHENHVRPT